MYWKLMSEMQSRTDNISTKLNIEYKIKIKYLDEGGIFIRILPSTNGEGQT